MKWVRIILIICLISLIAGCSMSLANSAWPKAFQNLDNTSLSPYNSSFINLMGIAWQYTGEAVHREGYFTSPIIGPDGTIYLGSERPNYLYAINPDGTLKWRYQLFDTDYNNYGYVYSVPAIDSNGVIYIGCKDGYLYAINSDGTLKWKYLTGDNVGTAVVIDSNNIIYFGSSDDYLYALNPDGNLKWKYQMEHTDIMEYGCLAIDSNGIVYFTRSSGTGPYSIILYAINSDGSLKWKITIVSGYITTNSSPVLDEANNQIYIIVPEAGYLYCYDFDGNQKWTLQINQSNNNVGTPSVAAFSGQYLYLVDDDAYDIHNIIKVDVNGNKIKTLTLNDGSNEKIHCSPVLDSNENLFIQYDNKLYIISSDLEIMKQVGLKFKDNYMPTSSAIAEDGTIYVVVDNTLYAIKPFKIQGVLDFSLPGRLIRA